VFKSGRIIWLIAAILVAFVIFKRTVKKGALISKSNTHPEETIQTDEPKQANAPVPEWRKSPLRKTTVKIPSKGQNGYTKVVKAFRTVIQKEEFAETEFNFSSGIITTTIDQKNKEIERKGVWYAGDSCRIEVKFTANWEYLDGYSECK
jgi:hypothetical protein